MSFSLMIFLSRMILEKLYRKTAPYESRMKPLEENTKMTSQIPARESGSKNPPASPAKTVTKTPTYEGA